jgi:NB-ARC domain-containing protein
MSPERIPTGVQAQAGLYRGLLADRRVLVVLDNARDAEQVRPLLPASPRCLVVITSRSQLTGLIAGHGARPLTLDVLSSREARALLARHLGAERISAEPRAVTELINHCGGLPLALAIVAARAATHPGFALRVLAKELAEEHTRLDALDTGDPQPVCGPCSPGPASTSVPRRRGCSGCWGCTPARTSPSPPPRT